MASDQGNETLIGTLEARFPWGLLLVSDEDSLDEIPPWQTDLEQVTSTATALVVRVQHEQEGTALVHVFKGSGDLPGEPVFSGTISTSAGVITVGDAVGDQLIRVPGLAKSFTVDVLLNRPVSTTHVDLVIDAI